MWKAQPSVYGPFATVIQAFAASIGHANVATTIWVMMILNGIVFIGVGLLLLLTSDDPVRATLFWTANPVLILELVSGGHLDTFVAAAAIGAIQIARRFSSLWGDAVVGVLIGLACGVKIYAVLIGLGLAWPLLRNREWLRITRITVAAVATLALSYSFYGLDALKTVFGGLKLVTLPSPWRVIELTGQWAGVPHTVMVTIISSLWPIALFVVAWLIYRRISSDQPAEVVGAVRADVRLDPRRPLGVRLVHRGGLGRADPGAAQPDEPVADHRHRAARPLPVQRRSRRPGHVTLGPTLRAGLLTKGDWVVTRVLGSSQAEADRRPGHPRHERPPGPVAARPEPACCGSTGWRSSCWPPAWLLRVLTQFAYRPALFYIDTSRYLYNAEGMDPVGYKGPLRAILFVANFGAVAAVQHLIGLAMAVLIYVLLLRRGVSRWLAALAIAPVLLDAYQLQTEQAIMPGTWFEALIVAGLALLLWRPRPGWRVVLAAGVVLGASATFAQVGEAMIVPG